MLVLRGSWELLRLGGLLDQWEVRRAPPGLAFGLALAVRPAGPAEAPRARVGPEDRFLRSGIAKDPCGWRGRPGQCAAFRPGRCDSLRRRRTRVSLTAWSSRPGAAPGDTAGTACGRSPGPPGAAARHAGGLPPIGRDESCRTANGAPPDLTPAAYGGPPWPLISLPVGCARFSRFTSRPSGPARRRCALDDCEENPHTYVPAATSLRQSAAMPPWTWPTRTDR